MSSPSLTFGSLLALLLFQAESSLLDNDMVLTPFGYWPESCVHGVNNGAHITNVDEHSFMIHDHIENTRITKQRCDLTYVRNKQKQFRARRRTSKFSNNLRAGDDKSKLVDGDGWQQYTKQNTGDSTSGLLGQWIVPTEPSRGDATLFTFTGLQNIDWVPPSPEPSQEFDIIQPVLQYGESTAGGGNYWTIASWYVTLGADVLYSKLQLVKSGTTIFGNMTKTGDETWYISAIDESNGGNTYITVSKSRLSSQPWIYVTLEVYSVYSCEQYPPTGTPIPYTNLKLYENNAEVTADWEIGTSGQNPPICDSTINITDANTVTITF